MPIPPEKSESELPPAGDPVYLSETDVLKWHNPRVQNFIQQAITDAPDPITQAVRLYTAVRDEIWYDPYSPFYLPEHYTPEFVIARGRGFCISKAALLCAVGRAVNIPCRLGFATVRNHLATRQLLEFIGTDLFVWHCYVELYLDGRWIKATPAFNRQLCQRHHVLPLEFDGRQDAMFQSYNLKQERFMEYVEHHGIYTDVPVNQIVQAWRTTYGAERVDTWIAELENNSKGRRRNFYREDVITA